MNGIQYQYYQNGENCFSEQTYTIENAGDVIINVCAQRYFLENI